MAGDNLKFFRIGTRRTCQDPRVRSEIYQNMTCIIIEKFKIKSVINSEMGATRVMTRPTERSRGFQQPTKLSKII